MTLHEPSVELLSELADQELHEHLDSLTLAQLRDLKERTVIHWRDHLDTAKQLEALKSRIYKRVLDHVGEVYPNE